MAKEEKYRIITNGLSYRISIKTLFGRKLVSRMIGPCGGLMAMDFSTKEAAEEYILCLEGKHPRQQWKLA